MKKKVFVLIVLLVFGCGSALWAGGLTSGKGKMSGIVTDKATGEPIEGVTVKLFLPEVNQFHTPSPVTGKDGRWKVVFIRKGNWNLDFEKTGYEIIKMGFFVDDTPGTKSTTIETKMGTLEGPVVAESVLKEIQSAQTLIAANKIDEALQTLLKVLKENQTTPGIDLVYLYIGNCYASKSEYEKSIDYYQKALDKFPKNKELILSIGNAYNNLKDYPRAMDWFAKLSIDEINNTDTLYNIGVIAYNNGNFEGAVTYYLKATIINPEFADAFYQLGMTYTALSKTAEAIDALKKFMHLAPTSPNFETAKAVVEAFNEAK